ncbi:MAG: hypothetical protein ACLR7D_12725 [Lachnospira eligens]
MITIDRKFEQDDAKQLKKRLKLMKGFSIKTEIQEFDTFEQFAKEESGIRC